MMVLEESSIFVSCLYKQIPFVSILVGILSNYFATVRHRPIQGPMFVVDRTRYTDSFIPSNIIQFITIKEPKLLFVRPKSRLESPLKRSRKRVKIAASRPERRSLSPIPLERPAVMKIRLLPGRREGSNGLWGKAAPQKLTQITLRQLPSGESFLAAVIQDDRNVASFAYDQSIILINRTLGDTRQVDSIAITLLTLNSWLLTGHLRPYSDVKSSTKYR